MSVVTRKIVKAHTSDKLHRYYSLDDLDRFVRECRQCNIPGSVGINVGQPLEVSFEVEVTP